MRRNVWIVDLWSSFLCMCVIIIESIMFTPYFFRWVVHKFLIKNIMIFKKVSPIASFNIGPVFRCKRENTKHQFFKIRPATNRTGGLLEANQNKNSCLALWAISSTNWNLPLFSPTCFARRKVREISIWCRNCSQGSCSYSDLPLIFQAHPIAIKKKYCVYSMRKDVLK